MNEREQVVRSTSVLVLHRQFKYLFKALLLSVLITVEVYTGNEIVTDRVNSIHKTQNELALE